MKDGDHHLHQILWGILFFARQGLALWGDKEDITDSLTNPGNFWALLNLFSQKDPLLHNHLHSPRAKNATYLSPKLQNKVINIIGNDIICADFVDAIKKAVFFLVMADEMWKSRHSKGVCIFCQVRLSQSRGSDGSRGDPGVQANPPLWTLVNYYS